MPEEKEQSSSLRSPSQDLQDAHSELGAIFNMHSQRLLEAGRRRRKQTNARGENASSSESSPHEFRRGRFS